VLDKVQPFELKSPRLFLDDEEDKENMQEDLVDWPESMAPMQNGAFGNQNFFDMQADAKKPRAIPAALQQQQQAAPFQLQQQLQQQQQQLPPKPPRLGAPFKFKKASKDAAAVAAQAGNRRAMSKICVAVRYVQK